MGISFFDPDENLVTNTLSNVFNTSGNTTGTSFNLSGWGGQAPSLGLGDDEISAAQGGTTWNYDPSKQFRMSFGFTPGSYDEWTGTTSKDTWNPIYGTLQKNNNGIWENFAAAEAGGKNPVTEGQTYFWAGLNDPRYMESYNRVQAGQGTDWDRFIVDNPKMLGTLNVRSQPGSSPDVNWFTGSRLGDYWSAGVFGTDPTGQKYNLNSLFDPNAAAQWQADMSPGAQSKRNDPDKWYQDPIKLAALAAAIYTGGSLGGLWGGVEGLATDAALASGFNEFGGAALSGSAAEAGLAAAGASAADWYTGMSAADALGTGAAGAGADVLAGAGIGAGIDAGTVVSALGGGVDLASLASATSALDTGIGLEGLWNYTSPAFEFTPYTGGLGGEFVGSGVDLATSGGFGVPDGLAFPGESIMQGSSVYDIAGTPLGVAEPSLWERLKNMSTLDKLRLASMGVQGLSGLWGAYNRNKQAKQFKSLLDEINKNTLPWDKDGGRKKATEVLQKSLVDPFSLPEDNAYRRMMQQALARREAAGGRSGNPIHAELAMQGELSKYLSERQRVLGGLAGVNFDPTNLANASMKGSEYLNQLRNSATDQITGAAGGIIGGLTLDKVINDVKRQAGSNPNARSLIDYLFGDIKP